MIELGQHAAFIVWAYLGVFIAMGTLIGLAILGDRRARGRLADLEARGIRRRSSGDSA
ncbi:heme exporter protein CcmD [Arsenicitalea aurantiaca]|uniref:Heme exporter protein D n=1 Tax=Arsenicitalea aurantiaca TaxID=1783274 RepID=A0A433X7J3_9HYPH|nr:heme exporter protein CcmD [Arsenicitalea aurantiaca]RUT30029.1 heme exporter protein CcmD [Arsenicitalea aurantiaca]